MPFTEKTFIGVICVLASSRSSSHSSRWPEAANPQGWGTLPRRPRSAVEVSSRSLTRVEADLLTPHGLLSQDAS
jgi:hypothetical protein